MSQIRSSGGGGGGGGHVCSPEWHCEAWSDCTDGKMTRSCTDVKSCGATSPETSKECGQTSGVVTEQVVQAPENPVVEEVIVNEPTGSAVAQETGSESNFKQVFMIIIALGILSIIAAIVLGYFFAKQKISPTLKI